MECMRVGLVEQVIGQSEPISLPQPARTSQTREILLTDP
jgi:hypothetical protein